MHPDTGLCLGANMDSARVKEEAATDSDLRPEFGAGKFLQLEEPRIACDRVFGFQCVVVASLYLCIRQKGIFSPGVSMDPLRVKQEGEDDPLECKPGQFGFMLGRLAL
jgi:hypothetical protein